MRALRRLLDGPSLLVLAFAAPVLLRALSYRDSLLDRDEAYWLSAAMRMRAEGLPPYVGGWDMKPPLVFAFYRVAVAVAPGSPLLAAHVMAALLAGLAGALVAAAARSLGGAFAGAAGSLAFALLDSTGTVKGLAAQTELQTYVPVAAMLWCLAESGPAGRLRGHAPAIAVGVCGAVAALGRQTSAVFLPAGALALLTVRGGPGFLRTALGTAAGAALVFGTCALSLAATGAWDDAVACAWTIPRERAVAGVGLADPSSYAGWLEVAIANPAVVLGLVALVAAGTRGGDRHDAAARTLRRVGPCVLAGGLAAVAGGAGFGHYLRQAYVPAAVAAGVGLAIAASRLAAPRTRVAAGAGAAVLVAAAAAADRAEQWRSLRWERYEGGDALAAAAWVRANVPEEGRLFVWGMHPDLYVTSGRTPATRFTATGWLVGTFTGGDRAERSEPREFVPGSWDRLFEDLGARPPEAIVDSAPAGVHGFQAWPLARFERLRAWVEERYLPAADAPGRYLCWRLR